MNFKLHCYLQSGRMSWSAVVAIGTATDRTKSFDKGILLAAWIFKFYRQGCPITMQSISWKLEDEPMKNKPLQIRRIALWQFEAGYCRLTKWDRDFILRDSNARIYAANKEPESSSPQLYTLPSRGVVCEVLQSVLRLVNFAWTQVHFALVQTWSSWPGPPQPPSDDLPDGLYHPKDLILFLRSKITKTGKRLSRKLEICNMLQVVMVSTDLQGHHDQLGAAAVALDYISDSQQVCVGLWNTSLFLQHSSLEISCSQLALTTVSQRPT